jgi:Holliday junction resolvase RusA-like endonuclease
MSALLIEIPGEMRGKGRPRFSRSGGRPYTDAKTANAETWVKCCAIDQIGQPCLEGPLRLSVDIGVGIPASWPKKRQAAALLRSIHPTGKPDADNSVKLICDALNKIVWKDDSQIVSLSVQKFYAAEPATSLTVWAL